MFKIVSTLCVIAQAGSLMTMNVSEKLTTDFLTGFESGLFLIGGKDSKQQFEEYNCAGQHIESDEFKAFQQALNPIKAMTKMMTQGNKAQQEQLDEIVTTIELFVGSFDKFIGVFDENYSGGDFCAGLTFGMQGAQMLEQVAQTLYETHLKSKARAARSHGPV